MKRFSRKHIVILCVSISFLIIFGYSYLYKKSVMFGDAQNYWQLSDSFLNGGFSFTNYENTFRGYVFPFILLIIKCFGSLFFHSEYGGFLFINSIIIALLLILLPIQLFNLKDKKRMLTGSIAITIIFIFFWKSFLVYSLSDVYSIVFFVLCIIALMKLELTFDNIGKSILYFAMFGFCAYITYNIRTVYKLPLLLIIIVFLIRNYKILFTMKHILSILVCLITFVSAGLPQILINEKYYKKTSLAVITDTTFGVDLTLQQLYWGIYYQRYETNVESLVGNEVTYPSVGVKFVDLVGKEIYKVFEQKEMSYINFIKMCFYSPLDTVGIYTRHAINAMNILYRDSYIESMNTNKSVVFILNFLIIMVGSFGIYLCRKKFNNIYLILSLIPALIAIPGAVEIRYVMYIYLTIYVCLCYLLDFKEFIWYFKNNAGLCSTIFIISFILNCTVISTTLKAGEAGVISFSKYGNTLNHNENSNISMLINID